MTPQSSDKGGYFEESKPITNLERFSPTEDSRILQMTRVAYNEESLPDLRLALIHESVNDSDSDTFATGYNTLT